MNNRFSNYGALEMIWLYSNVNIYAPYKIKLHLIWSEPASFVQLKIEAGIASNFPIETTGTFQNVYIL